MQQMEAVVVYMVGKRIMYKRLIADNGLPSVARPKRAES